MPCGSCGLVGRLCYPHAVRLTEYPRTVEVVDLQTRNWVQSGNNSYRKTPL